MNISETTKSRQTPIHRDFAALLRYQVTATKARIGGRRALILLGVVALGVGAALNWGWLTAIGVAPLILALAPCAAMCALGLCMHKMGGQSRSSNGQEAKNGAQPAAIAKPHEIVELETVDARAAHRRYPDGA